MQRMTLPQVTAIFLAVVLILVGLYDALIGISGIPDATVSKVVQDISSRHPILPFAVGVLIGHLFWSK